jgi:hypothetical protein
MPEHDLLDSGVVCEHGDDGIAAAGVAYPSAARAPCSTSGRALLGVDCRQ